MTLNDRIYTALYCTKDAYVAAYCWKLKEDRPILSEAKV